MGNRKTFLMNITVRTYGPQSYICRPDTTWERENRDFFSPDYVNEIWYSPVIFARISKAGKYIGGKFASRYYDGMNFGILLYPGEILNSPGHESLAAASVLDHTSILPFPLYQPVVFSSPGNILSLKKNDSQIFGTSTDGLDGIGIIEDTICNASKIVSQRIGDLVAAELSAPALLVGKNEKKARISASFCENELFGLSVIR